MVFPRVKARVYLRESPNASRDGNGTYPSATAHVSERGSPDTLQRWISGSPENELLNDSPKERLGSNVRHQETTSQGKIVGRSAPKERLPGAKHTCVASEKHAVHSHPKLRRRVLPPAAAPAHAPLPKLRACRGAHEGLRNRNLGSNMTESACSAFHDSTCRASHDRGVHWGSGSSARFGCVASRNSSCNGSSRKSWPEALHHSHPKFR